ncbi:hypothetical protein CPC735_034170 [Coccidioides posadasii C735 delta SOWgp]|uniref:Uncharacterized protein n=1 Tax=Coccidioides posadasii (strain C735) TaxID=222929 RepID=C5P5U1_COCP7|nr:hypothetical protein CPC735_034170 [Coccidioides posadasii C735 delta SOWgp]EER28081.1 hypothetical protein CPC735_034170 [Coccidioides posadasii C735 delta SOWgp]|eukprot:XP_003070226.1 hypothetical protein CPC735_034170 [Coccidioides posadasii C735 delta SOWgp]
MSQEYGPRRPHSVTAPMYAQQGIIMNSMALLGAEHQNHVSNLNITSPSTTTAATTAKRSRKRRTPLHKAEVKELADQRCSAPKLDVDNRVVERLKKCIQKANHPNTSEAEAKAALFLSSKLMTQYNISMLDVLNADDKQEDGLHKHGGQSIVEIRKSRQLNARPNNEGFVSIVAHAMDTFFDCKHYSTQGMWYIRWTFYGIALNTVSAAMAFEMVYNLISNWACDQKGGSSAYSYSMGVARGLLCMAREDKTLQATRAQKEEAERLATEELREQQHRQQELGRLGVSEQLDGNPTGTSRLAEDSGEAPYKAHHSDDDCDEEDDQGGPTKFEGVSLGDVSMTGFDEDIKADFSMQDDEDVNVLGDWDEQMAKLVKKEPSDPDDMSALQNLNVAWSSETQLIRFQETASQVADEFLQEQGVKLSHRNTRRAGVRDPNAYNQGKRDSRKINVRQKQLEH